MNKFGLTLKTIVRAISIKSPDILTGLGLTGFVFAVWMGIRVAPKAEGELALWLYHNGKLEEELTLEDRYHIYLKYYMPTAGMVILSGTSILLANRIQANRLAAIAGLYTATSETLRHYQDAIMEEFGESKLEKIRGDVSEKTIEDNPNTDKAIITGHGPTLMMDSLSGRYFYSSMETVRQQINNVNESLLSDGFVTLNDLYYELGLASNGIGNNAGWETSKNGLIKVEFDSIITPDGQTSAIVVIFNEPTKLWF